MYLVYLLKEKRSENVIYVGSSARPSARMKEHIATLKGKKPSNQKLYAYMRDNELEFYKDVEVIWVDCGNDKYEALELEEKYYYIYEDTLLNDRPAENRTGSFNPKRRVVKCLDDGKVFNTVSECASYYGLKRTTLSNVLHGYKSNKTGLRFEFNNTNV